MEREFKGNDKWVVNQSQDGSLSEDMSDLARSTCNIGFPDRLESVDTLRVLFANLHDLSKGTLPDHFEQVERVDRQGLMPSRLIGDGKME